MYSPIGALALMIIVTPAMAQLGGGSSSSSSTAPGAGQNSSSAAPGSAAGSPSAPSSVPGQAIPAPGSGSASPNSGDLLAPPPPQSSSSEQNRSQGQGPVGPRSLESVRSPSSNAVGSNRAPTSARCKTILQSPTSYTAAEVSLCRQDQTADERMDQIEQDNKRAIRSICPSC